MESMEINLTRSGMNVVTTTSLSVLVSHVYVRDGHTSPRRRREWTALCCTHLKAPGCSIHPSTVTIFPSIALSVNDSAAF